MQYTEYLFKNNNLFFQNGFQIIIEYMKIKINTPADTGEYKATRLNIKPYLPYTDSHPDARSGFAPTPENHLLEVSCPDLLLQRIPETEVKDILDILAHDPRPQYHQNPERIYHLIYNQTEISFQVSGNALIVTSVTRVSHSGGAR